MDKKSKKYLFGMLASIALMFIWIFLTVLLTGGRETTDFTDTDNKIFMGFIVVEITTCIVMFVFAIKVGKINYKNNSSVQYIPKTKQEKVISRRGNLLLLSSYVLALAVMITGIITGKNFTDSSRIYFKWILAISCIMPALLFPLNILLKKRYIRNLERKQVGEMQQYLLSHREYAKETSETKLAFIRKWRLLSDLYAIIFSIFAFGIAFCAGVLHDTVTNDTSFTVPLCFVSAFSFLCTFSRIRFSPPKSYFNEDKTYISSDEYPKLYSLAQKAADTLHCDGEIKIAILGDCNAGIGKIGNVISVQIGAVLLSILSKEELYNTLLHEFSHMSSENELSNKEAIYNTWLCNGGNAHFLSGLTSLLFCYSDIVYNLQYNLYWYASSILRESTADQAMAYYGNAKIAASSLLKMKYYELFSWEKGTYDEESLYSSEEPDKLIITKEVELFKKAVSLQADKWNRLIDVEILSRNASHPTLKMRLETLGVTNPQILESVDSDEYKNECTKAVHYVEELIYQNRITTYSKDREAIYLKPKQLVEFWEASGNPLIAEEYADIDQALRQLGRVIEADDLCKRAIDEFSNANAASCYAYFMRGNFLLHCYDVAGIDYVYHAIENNKNYIDEGLEVIGTFCCLTGREEELKNYRERALDLAQKTKDKYNQIGILNKKDHLSSEKLPDGMLDEILNFISSVSNDTIQNIYLVRKNITDDFFTSVFIIEFDVQTEIDIQNEILHKIFRYLDTSSSWQFSLFNYTEVAKVRVETIENSCVFSKNC